MAERPLLCYITDRSAFDGDERNRSLHLLGKIAEAASQGVDYIQLREKDLAARELESLAREALSIIRKQTVADGGPKTRLLINSRTDVALAAAADGVHLPADDLAAEAVRFLWERAGDSAAREIASRTPVISVSCHSQEEVFRAAASGATFAIFAPVFEKKNSPGSKAAGLDALREACRANMPVLALGGVTLQNAGSCLAAGAAGIAAIRLFQENDIASVMRKLRG